MNLLYFIILCCTAFIDAGSINTSRICGNDSAYKYYATTSKCYKIHTVFQPFSRAQQICTSEGGHLAIINSEQESRVLKVVFATSPLPTSMSGYAFIGFHDPSHTRNWKTLQGESIQAAGFSRFAPGEPNHYTGDEYCGSISREGLLNDLKCEYAYSFICEKQPDLETGYST